MVDTGNLLSGIMMLTGIISLVISLYFSHKKDNRETNQNDIEVKVNIERLAVSMDSVVGDMKEMKSSNTRIENKVDDTNKEVFGIKKELQAVWKRIDEHTAQLQDNAKDINLLKGGKDE